MSAVKGNERASEYTLTDTEFRFLCKLVYDSTGIVLGEHKREMVYRRLMRRTRELRIGSFKDYCGILKSGDSVELPNFINAITTNLTGFFRESHHFDYLRENFIPSHLTKYSETKRLRIWSSACSTGEEPYSLSITLAETMGSLLDHWDAKILATDLDSNVIEIAKKGIYNKEKIKKLPVAVRNKWFKKSKDKNSDDTKINPSLAEYITFKQLNLLEKWPMRGPFDVIMCRNVLIYFDRETQAGLIQRFHQLIRPGGLLILGHSESLSKNDSSFEVQGRTIFRKPVNSYEYDV